jgi:hypothetical protein
MATRAKRVGTGTPEGTAYERRSDFLIAMYEQLMGDINRHIVVVWQMVGVLGAAIAGLVIAEKQGVPTSYAVILAMVVIAWVLEHLHDSNFWYNRNLVMITNIERVFLTPNDVDLIHPYFAAHRKPGSFLTHLQVQRRYALAIAILTMLYFLAKSILPTWDPQGPADFGKLGAIAAFIFVLGRDRFLQNLYDKKYGEYLSISPGIAVPKKVDYGATHGVQ